MPYYIEELMELDPPLAAFTDLDDEHGTLDVNKCDELDAPWIAQKREKDAEERESRAMMAKKSAEASVLKAEAAKKRQKDLKAKADAKRKKAQMLTAVAEKAARRRENDRRRKSFQDAAAAHEYRGPSSSFGEMGENNNEEDEDAAYTLLAALKGGDSARDAAFYSNNNNKGKSKPKSRRRPAETIDSGGGDRYTKPRAAPRRRCLECSTCLNPRLKKRCLGREEGFIEDDDSPVKPAEYFNQGPTRGADGPGYSPVAENDSMPANVDEDSPEKLLEEVERDLNTVVFPQEMTVSPQEMTAINAERIANLTRLRDTYYPEPTARPPADAGAAAAAALLPPPLNMRHNNTMMRLQNKTMMRLQTEATAAVDRTMMRLQTEAAAAAAAGDTAAAAAADVDVDVRLAVGVTPSVGAGPSVGTEVGDEPPAKRGRGRPPGSKTKPKPGRLDYMYNGRAEPPALAPAVQASNFALLPPSINAPAVKASNFALPPSIRGATAQGSIPASEPSDVDETAYEPAVRPLPGLHGADRWDVNPLTGVEETTGQVISDVFAGGRPTSWLVRLLASYMAVDKLGRQRVCVVVAALEEKQYSLAERLVHDLHLESVPGGKHEDPVAMAWTYRLLQYAYVKQGERESDAMRAGECAEKIEREIRANANASGAGGPGSWNNITGHGGELPVGGWQTTPPNSSRSPPATIATAGRAGAVGILFDLIMANVLGVRPTKEDWTRVSHNAHSIAAQHPNDALILHLYGGLLWRRGEMRAASMVLMKAYQHDGQRARAAPWAFETLLLMGDKEGATAVFERIHRFNPTMSLRLKRIATRTIEETSARGPWPESLQDKHQPYHPGAIDTYANRGRT